MNPITDQLPQSGPIFGRLTYGRLCTRPANMFYWRRLRRRERTTVQRFMRRAGL